jgi:hypothetical protein
MKYPVFWTLRQIKDYADNTQCQLNGRWVPARPRGYPSFLTRLRLAWMVFTGRADALVWPEGQ